MIVRMDHVRYWGMLLMSRDRRRSLFVAIGIDSDLKILLARLYDCFNRVGILVIHEKMSCGFSAYCTKAASGINN